eukprot:2428521-Prymnesium_polylepis.2
MGAKIDDRRSRSGRRWSRNHAIQRERSGLCLPSWYCLGSRSSSSGMKPSKSCRLATTLFHRSRLILRVTCWSHVTSMSCMRVLYTSPTTAMKMLLSRPTPKMCMNSQNNALRGGIERLSA